MIQYCKRCCLPSTKPHLAFDEEGICNACRNYENRKNVDWDERKKELMAILDRYRSKDGSNWDCIIPVSGGQDSTYQVVTMLELGMNPLCVTATTCDLTDIGRRNIENIKKMGVDYIEVTTNRIVRAKLNRIGLLEVGDISWPEHVSIFTVPVRMAVNFNIPLIIWGENSQNEYGGPAAAVENNVLDRRWLEEFGGMLGLRVNDLVGQEGITKKDLMPFTYPSDEELKRVGVTGIFLGYYIPWEGLHNVLVAKAHGFESWGKVVEGDYDDYENLDNYQAGIHEYFKFLKFGFGRCSDQASMHIRRGRISRDEAMKIVKERDGAFRWTYLDKRLEDILEPLDITVDEFIKVCDEFTNKKLFLTDKNGKLIKDKKGNLTKINYDNVDLITLSGHKIHSFKASGLLIKRHNTNLEPLITGGGHQHNLRSGTTSVPIEVSLAKAIRLSFTYLEKNYLYVKSLQEYFFLQGSKINNLKFNSTLSSSPYIISFYTNKKASVVAEALSNKEIYVSTKSACSSKKESSSYVLEAMHKDKYVASNSIRVSFDEHNTKEEIDIFFKELEHILKTIK